MNFKEEYIKLQNNIIPDAEFLERLAVKMEREKTSGGANDDISLDVAMVGDQKPLEVVVESRRASLWKPALLAACLVCVLAVGVFALMNFRLGGGIEPAPIRNGSDSSVSDSVSSEYSSDSDSSNIDSSDESSDNGSEMDPPFTKQDLELQAILKDLTANAADIDGIFTRLENQGEGIPRKVGAEYFGAYYTIDDGRRTEPGWLFAVPQTRSELEQLLLTCFTRRAANFYMNCVGTGQITVDTEGKNVLIAERGWEDLIEADGRLYRSSEDNSYFMFDVDYTTARVTSKTDKTIRFTYFDSSGTPGKTEGVIMLEGGSWKLDFFHRQEFIPELPTEFTEEELELQDILNELSATEEIADWFYSFPSANAEFLKFKFNDPDNFTELYALVPKDKIASKSGLEYPQSCEELAELLPKYFTQKTVDLYMSFVTKGSMTENPDGTYNITADGNYNFYRHYPRFIEIDGNMYGAVASVGDSGTPIWGTAQITEKTADSIRFTMYYRAFGSCFSREGILKFERGGWKINYDFRGISTE